MFLDIAPSEFLLVAVVAVVVIGPKDLPRALRTAGRWMGTVRRVSGHFRAGVETMIREAEMEDMEKKWREQNEAIMQAHPTPVIEQTALLAPDHTGHAADVAPELAAHAPTDPLPRDQRGACRNAWRGCSAARPVKSSHGL